MKNNYFNSHLNEIGEVNHTGERLNSTVVGWGEDAAHFIIGDTSKIPHYIPGNNEYLKQIVAGDYNGDGAEDAFLVYLKELFSGDYWLYKWYDFVNDTLYYIDAIYATADLEMHFTNIDFNGDGYDDLCRTYNQDNHKKVDFMINNKSKGYYPFNWSSNQGAIPEISLPDTPRYIAIDIDGDNKGEVIRLYRDVNNGDRYKMELYELTSLGNPFTATFVASKTFEEIDI